MIIEVQSAVRVKWLFLSHSFNSWKNGYSGLVVIVMQSNSELGCELVWKWRGAKHNQQIPVMIQRLVSYTTIMRRKQGKEKITYKTGI